MKIVQLGACWGDDHVTELVKSTDNVEFLLLVEPNPKIQNRLKECYRFFPDVNIEQVAIVPTYENGKELDMFFTELDTDHQLTSLIKNHVEKHNYPSESIKTFKTKCITLSELLDKYNITNLDYLFIDIEGVDAEVLLNLDLNKYNIKNICIEVIHLQNKDKVYAFLKEHGYIETADIINMYDKMFVKQG